MFDENRKLEEYLKRGSELIETVVSMVNTENDPMKMLVIHWILSGEHFLMCNKEGVVYSKKDVREFVSSVFDLPEAGLQK